METLPASWYVDSSHFEDERRAVFGRSWLVVGRAEQVAEPGQYAAVEVVGWPLLLVRGDDGVLRGFHDVCRHRAGPLTEAAEGTCSSFVCRYHGWAYGLDGRLLSARDFGADVDAAGLGLLPIAVRSWRGLVWACLSGEGEPPLAALDALTEGLPIEELTFSHQVVHDLACNWKTYADNYLEGYHIPLVHRALNKELDAKRYRVDVHERDRIVVHSAPTRDGAVNAGKWLWIWPDTALNVYPDGMNVERYFPMGADRTRIVYWYFFREPGGGGEDPGAAAANQEVVRMSTEVTLEDKAICEAVQRNLAAGVYGVGVLSPKHEMGVSAFQSWVRRAVGNRD